MAGILQTSAGYIIVMFLGLLARNIKAARKVDAVFLSRIILNITLPCALVISYQPMNVSWDMISALLLAIAANVTLLLVGYMVALENTGAYRAISMVNMSGFNIAIFTMPLIMKYFDESFWVYAVLFFMGNAFMCTGPNNVLAALSINHEEHISVQQIIGQLFMTLPFVVFAILFVLAFLKINLPAPLVDFAKLCGSANNFLLFFMIGLMLDFSFTRSSWHFIGQTAGLRLAVNAFIALLVYFVFPLAMEVKQILVLCLMSPVSELDALFSLRYDHKSSIPAVCNMISFAGSMLLTFLLILLFT